MKNQLLFLILFLLNYPSILNAQDNDRKIQFPDIPGFQTLITDLHIHTVFSDGSVWPDIRVDEAVKDGLDAIALTEHIEYQPHLDDMPHPDRNRSYEIAKKLAIPHDLLVIHGVELTRSMPPGHSNALFIEDANKFMIEDPVAQFEEAKRQGAFVFWNHPNWVNQNRTGITEVSKMHKDLIKKKLLHGIEVINDITYSDQDLTIGLKHGLTLLGTSDIHGLVDWQFNLATGGHRPVTLVFARERTQEAIKKALFDRKTVAWFNDILVGEEENLNSLLKASLIAKRKNYLGPSSILNVEIKNNSDAKLLIKNLSKYTFHDHGDVIEVPAQAIVKMQIKTVTQLDRVELEFEVLNALVAKNEHARVKLIF